MFLWRIKSIVYFLCFLCVCVVLITCMAAHRCSWLSWCFWDFRTHASAVLVLMLFPHIPPGFWGGASVRLLHLQSNKPPTPSLHPSPLRRLLQSIGQPSSRCVFCYSELHVCERERRWSVLMHTDWLANPDPQHAKHNLPAAVPNAQPHP